LPDSPPCTPEPHGYTISTDPSRLDRDAIWQFLRTSYWAKNVARDVVERAIENSLAFGLYTPGGDQAGFARAVTGRACGAAPTSAGRPVHAAFGAGASAATARLR